MVDPNGEVVGKDNKKDDLCIKNSTGENCISEGQIPTLDGATGRILNGFVPKMEPATDRYFATVLQWSNQYRRMDVLGFCDQSSDVCEMMQFGADGIGLLSIQNL